MSSLMTFKEWFQHPLSYAANPYQDGSPPQLDLQAIRPPAVKVWEDFRQQAEACFETFSWPPGQIPQSVLVKERHNSAAMAEFGLLRSLAALEAHSLLSSTGGVDLRVISLGSMIKFGQQDGIAITTSLENEDSALRMDNLEEDNLATKRSSSQRMIERLYGKLICEGVSFGIYVTESSCHFMRIDPSDGCLMISRSFRHDAEDFTAKQGLLYLATEAVKRPTPALSPPKSCETVETCGNRFDKDLFQGLDNVQTIRIHDMRLSKFLGSGNAAQVYEAELDGKAVAIKVARVDGPLDNGNRSMPCPMRLVEEIKVYEALKVLQGTVIPKVHAYGLVENRVGDSLPFLAIEKIDGDTLNVAMRSMPEAALPDAVKAVKAAFAKLHSTGYTQGSVKPQNVMLCQDGRAVIIDFGRGSRKSSSSISVRNTFLCCWRAADVCERALVRDMLVELVAEKLNICKGEAEAKMLQWNEGSNTGEESTGGETKKRKLCD